MVSGVSFAAVRWLRRLAGPAAGAADAVAGQPAAWTVPAALPMVLVSRATKDRGPRTLTQVMARLHTPERPLATER